MKAESNNFLLLLRLIWAFFPPWLSRLGFQEMASNNTSTLNFLNVKPAVVYASCTLNGIIALLAILGNSSVLLAFFRTSKVRKYHTNYFIVSLALADLTVGCVTIPLYSYMIATNFADYGPKGPLYNVYLVFDVFSGVASIQHLMFISVER